jgi:hypothetical protein
VIEYVGRLACMAGYRKERIRAAEYLGWLIEQRNGEVRVEDTDRPVRSLVCTHLIHAARLLTSPVHVSQDCTTMKLPSRSVGFITGHKGEGLRHVEGRTHTFIFTNSSDRGGDTEDVRPAFCVLPPATCGLGCCDGSCLLTFRTARSC